MCTAEQNWKMMERWMYGTLFVVFISVYSNPIDCDFEKDPCSWSLEGFRRISYNQSNTTGGMKNDKPRNGLWKRPPQDGTCLSDIVNRYAKEDVIEHLVDILHTNFGQDIGDTISIIFNWIEGKLWYLYCDATNESYATLKSKPTTINGLQCLNFWYRVSGQDKSQIQVIVQDIGGGNDSVIWERSHIWYTGWLLATVELDVQTSSMVTILIRGKAGRSHSKIEIDDIVVKLASCLDCNFLDGLCSWKGNRWTVATDEKNYAVSECKSLNDLSSLSSDVDISTGEKCLSFKYQTKYFQMVNVSIGVWSDYVKQRLLVWESGWRQIQGWMKIGVDINLRNKSSILIEFLHRNCSNVKYYISSISLKKQSCAATSTPKPTIATASSESMTTNAATSDNNNSVAADVDTIVNTASSGIITSVMPSKSSEVIALRADCSRADCTDKHRSGSCTSCQKALCFTDIDSVGQPNQTRKLNVILATVIGCFVVIIAVLLVSVCYYRRKYLNNKPKAPMTNADLYEAHAVVSSIDNYDQIISLSSGRELDTSERVNSNAEPEYLTIVE